MTNLYKLMFFLTLTSGSLIAISSYSWLGMWMGLEINLLSMIPLMNSSKNILSSESSMKYFITQVIASSILLLSLILLNSDTPLIPSMQTSMLMTALLIKMGAAPFHFWFPEIMEGLSWLNSAIMLTWQKLAPMLILINNFKETRLITFSIITSLIIGGTMGMNQTSLRKILTYSSINHIGWMLAAMTINKSTWIVYFLIYSVISVNTISFMKMYNINYIPQIFTSKNLLLKLTFLVNFLNMGGIPPFLGFLPKWLVLSTLVNQGFVLPLIMVLITLLTLYFYLRTVLPSITLTSSETNLTTPQSKNFNLWVSNWINITSLILAPLLFNLS